LLFLWFRLTMGEIRQTEKPMDFAVLNAVITEPSLPLQDPWMSGERFSYYHFGTFLFGLPFRAAGVTPEYAYNLLASLLAGLSTAALFGAVRLRRGGRGVAAFGGVFLVVAGTLDGARQFFVGKSTPPPDSLPFFKRAWEQVALLFGHVDVWPSSRRVAN